MKPGSGGIVYRSFTIPLFAVNDGGYGLQIVSLGNLMVLPLKGKIGIRVKAVSSWDRTASRKSEKI